MCTNLPGEQLNEKPPHALILHSELNPYLICVADIVLHFLQFPTAFSSEQLNLYALQQIVRDYRQIFELFCSAVT